MTEEEKRHALTDVQRLALNAFEREFEKYAVLRWIETKPTHAPVDDEIVWAREVDALHHTLALTATRESLNQETIRVRAVAKHGGRGPILRDENAVGLQTLYQTLVSLIGYGPVTPSTRRPNQRLRRSGSQSMTRRRSRR